ncbi:MAG: hypothetical protein NWF14_01095 [Candidatus Bathyarchaeota archaeon]|nr:hypothetical protein [Candidatus Bathyarchaeota archaeon]
MSKRRRSTLKTEEINLEPPNPQGFNGETCMNPWNGKCSNTDIILYIMYEGSSLPICHKCWMTISSKDIEWMYD